MNKEIVELERLEKEEMELTVMRRQKGQLRAQATAQIMKSAKWGFRDSDAFKEVKSALTSLNQYLGQEASEDNARQFQEAHASLGTACKNYLEKSANAKTKRGRHRHDLVTAVKKLHSMEKEGVNSLRSKKYREKAISDHRGKNWGEYLGNYRKKRASVKEKDIIYHGAAMNRRMEVKLGDETVFFTKKSKAEGPEKFAKDFLKTVSDDYLKTALEYEFTMERGNLQKKRLFLQRFAKKAAPVMKSDCDTEQKRDGLEACLNKCMEKHKDDFSGYFCSVVKKRERLEPLYHFADGYKRKCFEDLTLQALREPNGINLAARNIATRRMAELLGVSDLVVNAGFMELIIDGKPHKGVYTTKAEGIDLNWEDGKQQVREAIQNDNPSFQKAVTGLHLLDAICGQIDRHAANMLYRTEEKDGKKVLTGIQGIDNELCFGLSEELSSNQMFGVGRGEKVYFTTKRGDVESIPAIDGNMACHIIALDRDTLDYTLRDILNKEEIEFLEKRVQKVQDLILSKEKKGQLLYEDREWTPEVAKKAKEHKTYYGKLTRYLEMGKEKTQQVHCGKSITK